MAETADSSALERCTGASDNEPEAPPPPAAALAAALAPAGPGDAAAPKTTPAAGPEGKVVAGVEGGSAVGVGGGGASDQLEAKPCDQDAALFKAEERIAEAKGGDAGGGGTPPSDVTHTTKVAAEDGVEKKSSDPDSEDASEDEESETTDSEDEDDEEPEDEEGGERGEEEEEKDEEAEEEEDNDDNEPPDTALMLEQVVNKLKEVEVQQGRKSQMDEDSEEASRAADQSTDIDQGQAGEVAPAVMSGEGTEAVSTEDESGESMKVEDGTSPELTDVENEGKNNKVEESADESDYLEARDSTSLEKSSFLKESFQSLKQKEMDDSKAEERKAWVNSKAWEATAEGMRETDEGEEEEGKAEAMMAEDDGIKLPKIELRCAMTVVGGPGLVVPGVVLGADEEARGEETSTAGGGELAAEDPVAAAAERPDDGGGGVVVVVAAAQALKKSQPGGAFEEQCSPPPLQQQQTPVEEPPAAAGADAVMEEESFMEPLVVPPMVEESVLEPLEAPVPEHLVLESSEQVRAFACEVARFLADLAVDIASERAFVDAEEDVGGGGGLVVEDAAAEDVEDEDTGADAAALSQSEDDVKPETKDLSPVPTTTVTNTTTMRVTSAPVTKPRIPPAQQHRVKGRAPPPPTMPATTTSASTGTASESKSAPISSGCELRHAHAVRVSVRAHAQAASAWPHAVPEPAADSVSSSRYQVRDYPVDDGKEEEENEHQGVEVIEDLVPEECPWRDAIRAAVLGCREEDLPPKPPGMQPRHEYFTYVSTLPAIARHPHSETWTTDYAKQTSEEDGEEGGDEEEEESSSGTETGALAAAAAETSALAKAAPPPSASSRSRRRDRRAATPRVADTEDEFEYATDEMPPVVTRRAITEPEDDEDDDEDEEEEDEEESAATTRQTGTPMPCLAGGGQGASAAAAGGMGEDETPLSSQPASAEGEAGAKAAALAASGPAQRRPPRSRWERWMRRFLGGLGAGLASQESTRGATGMSSSTVVDPGTSSLSSSGGGGASGGAKSGPECGGGPISQTGSLPRGATSLGRLAATLRARTLPAAFHTPTQLGKGKRTKEEKQRAKEEKELEKQRRRAQKQQAAGGSTATTATSAAAAEAAAAEALGALATMKRRSAQLWRRTLGLRRGDSGSLSTGASGGQVPAVDGATAAGNRYVQGQGAVSGAEAAMEEVSLGRPTQHVVEVVAAPVIVCMVEQQPDRNQQQQIGVRYSAAGGGGGGGGSMGGGASVDDLDDSVAAMGQGEDEAMAHAEPRRR